MIVKITAELTVETPGFCATVSSPVSMNSNSIAATTTHGCANTLNLFETGVVTAPSQRDAAVNLRYFDQSNLLRRI